MYERINAFLKPNDIFVVDTAMTALAMANRVDSLPDGVDVEAQCSWGAIGWGTPEILGNCLADPSRRAIVLAGEGGHQMTANELGTMAKYGAKPIFLMANNYGYFGERVTNRYPDESYNDTAPWDFPAVAAAMGCKDWVLETVTTLGELDAALEKAASGDTGAYIEMQIDPYDCPKGADEFYTLTGAFFGMEGRKWEGWLEELAAKKK
jgi:indolepyruvate decarboxylase